MRTIYTQVDSALKVWAPFHATVVVLCCLGLSMRWSESEADLKELGDAVPDPAKAHVSLAAPASEDALRRVAAPQQGLSLVAHLGFGLTLDCKRQACETPVRP